MNRRIRSVASQAQTTLQRPVTSFVTELDPTQTAILAELARRHRWSGKCSVEDVFRILVTTAITHIDMIQSAVERSQEYCAAEGVMLQPLWERRQRQQLRRLCR